MKEKGIDISDQKSKSYYQSGYLKLNNEKRQGSGLHLNISI
jgi:hypothetical protein